MNKAFKVMLIVVFVGLSGCAINRESASFDPNRDIVGTEVFFVERFEPDNRGLEQLIADNLSVRGYSATVGEKGEVPDKVDAIVTYVDKWMWDMRMYLLELTISFRDPATGIAFATGNSYHTSLTALTPEEMIDEILNNIFLADEDPAAVESSE